MGCLHAAILVVEAKVSCAMTRKTAGIIFNTLVIKPRLAQQLIPQATLKVSMKVFCMSPWVCPERYGAMRYGCGRRCENGFAGEFAAVIADHHYRLAAFDQSV